MTMISPINNNTANLSAVKIRINNPVTNVPEEMKGKVNEGQYNAVDIEVNRPEVNVNKKPIYEYPQYNQIVTYDMLVLPEKTSVPEPNVVTKDEQNNVSFKANPEVEIVPAKEIKPEIDLNIVISNLKNSNFDIQALEMENITKTSTLEPEKAKNFITEDVFASLIDIVNKDTSELDGPSEKQIEVRKKIIINKIIEEQTKTNNPNVKPEEIELPYQISKEDLQLAMELTTMEQAERNKEYALYTIASLIKIYVDDVKELSGNIIPITDLPGISSIVDSLKTSSNSSIKIAAIDALRFIARPEYNEEIESLFTIASKDSNPIVARNASLALESLKQQ